MSIAQISRLTDRFPSIESALSACRTIAVENGYGLRLLSKKTNRQGVITSRQVVCDRAGSGESRSKGIRRSGSIRCDCKFALSIRLSGDEYIIDISNPNHNHPPSVSAYSQPSNTRLSETEKKEVIDKSELGIPPRIILAELRSKGCHATSTAVYNCIAKHRKLQLGDQSPISALLRILEGKDGSDSGNEDKKWWYDYLVDTDDCLTHLFFQHTTSITLLRQFPEVIIMDCTYSTNRFGMPLLHIVGCTNINTTFEVGYAFLSQETEADYTWALGTLRKILHQNNIPEPGVIATDRELALMNAIEQEFPLAKNILCFWHIKMAFQSFLGKGLDDDGIKDFTEDFMEVVHATTVAEFSERWSSYSAKWTVVHPYGQQVVTYLKDTWLPYADCFVHCHIKGHLHLGHLTTSKVEGAHHYVKMFIGDSTGHLFTVVKRIKTALGEQYQRYQDMLHKEQSKGIMSGSLYRGVNSSICRHALKLVEDQEAYLEKHQLRLRKFGIPIPECTCNFTVSMGLPCYHIIEQKLLCYQRLTTTDFHRHWHLIPPSTFENQRENIVNFGDNEIDPDSMSWSRDDTVQTFGGSHLMDPGVNEIRDPVIRRSKRMRLAANLTPTNSVVNGLINSTQRQPSRHEQAASIIIEDVDLAPPALSMSSSNPSSSGTGAQRLCSGCRQPGHTYRTCGRRRVTVVED